jgi:cyclic pyranopterin phosphate synthase
MEILRSGGGDNALRQAIGDSMGSKPLGHDFTQQMVAPQVVHFMSTTGG